MIETISIASCVSVIAAFLYGFLYGKRLGRQSEKDRCIRIVDDVQREGRYSPSASRIYRSIEDDLPYLVADTTEENETADYRTSARQPIRIWPR